MARKRVHGHRCHGARTSLKRCRCVCRGQKHGAGRRTDNGLLKYITKERRV